MEVRERTGEMEDNSSPSVQNIISEDPQLVKFRLLSPLPSPSPCFLLLIYAFSMIMALHSRFCMRMQPAKHG